MDEINQQLRELKLSGMLSALKNQTEQHKDLDFETRLSFLLQDEILRRKNNRISYKLKTANLRDSACFEDLIFSTDRNLNKKEILTLANFHWIEKRQHLIITGATGVGKSYLASALTNKFCRADQRAVYFKTSELISSLSFAKASGKFYDFLIKTSKIPLIILDEWLREPLNHEMAKDISDLIDERYRKASIIFCSQLPVADWHKKITDPSLADAILDRIVHDSIRIELKGDSMRQKTASLN